MAINLLNLKPNVVSRDLSGYITLIYGPAKIGKTTFASKMPKPLLLAFEAGYHAIPGIIAQDITTWGEMKQVMRELKKPEVKEQFSSIVIDTCDIAADLCQKYICQQLGIENIGDGGWSTNGWAKYKKEFEETFRSLAMMGYAIVFISHDKEKTISPKQGKEYQQIGSSMQSSALSIIENMCDLISYAHLKVNPETGESKRVLTLRSLDDSIRCGGRFANIKPEIDFSYDALTTALREAIDSEAAEHDNKFVADKVEKPSLEKTFDYNALMAEFNDLAGTLMSKNQSNGPLISAIINKYLGKGKKIADATPEQAEFISLIIQEMREDLLNK